MSSRTTERGFRLTAKDETLGTWLTFARTVRSVSSVINSMISLSRILVIAQTMEGISVTQLIAKYTILRYAKIAAAVAGLAAGGIGLIALVAGLAAGAAGIPIAQTQPGQFRMVHATRPILAHAGEVIGRPREGGAGLGAGGPISIGPVYISNEGDSPTQAWQRTRDEVRRLAFWWPR